MKLSTSLLLSQLADAVPGRSELDQLDHFRQQAKDFFDAHGDAFRSQFVGRWVGDGEGHPGRFEKIIANMEKAYNRCGTHLDAYVKTQEHLDALIGNHPPMEGDNADVDGVDVDGMDVDGMDIDGERPRKSKKSKKSQKSRKSRETEDEEEEHHLNGQRIMHVLRGMERWVDYYLKECKNQDKLLNRMKIVIKKYEDRLKKMNYFEEDAIEERAYRADGAQKCGAVWNRPGNTHYGRTHYDGDQINHIGYEYPYALTEAQTRPPYAKKWWDDDIQSLEAYAGCWIAIYEDEGYGGYSYVCNAVGSSDTVSCEVNGALGNGALQKSQASSLRCFCNQPPPPTCGMLYHQSDHAPVIIKAGTKVPQLQRPEGSPMRYFTSNESCSTLNPHLCWGYDLDDAQVKRACTMELYDEKSYVQEDLKSPVQYNWNAGKGSWMYTGQYPNGRWVKVGTPDNNSNADYKLMHREHDVQSITCSCNVWITGVKYIPDKPLSEFEKGTAEEHPVPYRNGLNVINGVMSDVQMPKTYKWINVLRDDYEDSINTSIGGSYGYNFGGNRMVDVPAITFDDLNETFKTYKFSRADIDSMNGDGTITRTDADTAHTVTGVSCNYNTSTQRCNIVFKKVPVTGTVEVTWNRGEKTKAKFESEHWFWEPQIVNISG